MHVNVRMRLDAAGEWKVTQVWCRWRGTDKKPLRQNPVVRLNPVHTKLPLLMTHEVTVYDIFLCRHRPTLQLYSLRSLLEQQERSQKFVLGV